MLSQTYSEERLSEILIPHEQLHPYPAASERKEWEALRDTVREAHIARGEAALGYEWPTILAVRHLDFVREGDRTRHAAASFDRRKKLVDLVLAECVEAKCRFLDDILNGIWAICEESFWGVPAHLGRQKATGGLPDVTKPTVDLFAAETSALLAWTVYLLAPQLESVSTRIVPRIEHEIQRRVLTPLMERDDFGWMGFQGRRVNNWNPWICSNWLTSALLIEKDAARRLAHVAKAMRALDNFVDPYPKDGGCDEGPSYWGRAGGALYDCLELLHSATGGHIDVYHEPLVREIGRFIYRVQIADRYFVNFADAPPLLCPCAGVVFGYGQRIGDPMMMALGAWAAQNQDIAQKGVTDSLGRALRVLFSLEDILAADPTSPLPRDVWLNEIQVMVARDCSGLSDGLFVAAKGGHNAESHNHNDVGHFIVYLDGKPLIVDVGVETYTAKTFSGQRYEIWTMQSAYHSLPTVNGVQQDTGRAFAASDVEYSAGDATAELRLGIVGAYPEGAGIKSWVRTVTLNRGRDVVVTDDFALASSSGDLTLSLMTPCDAYLGTDGQIVLAERPLPDGRASGAARVDYNADKLTASVEQVPIEDERLRGFWGEGLRRIVLKARNATAADTWSLRIAPRC